MDALACRDLADRTAWTLQADNMDDAISLRRSHWQLAELPEWVALYFRFALTLLASLLTSS
jgi:hypothetical protein